MVPHADYQSICVTWLLHFPFHLFALLQPFTVLKLKIGVITSKGAIFQGKIAIFCCMIAKVHLGMAMGDEVTSFVELRGIFFLREMAFPHMIIYTLFIDSSLRP